MKANTKYDINPNCIKRNKEASKERTLNLIDQLKDISRKIEDYIGKSFNTEENNVISEETALDQDILTFSVQQQITWYQDIIQSIQAKMESLYNLKRIENIEKEIRVKSEQLYNVKSENTMLMAIQKNHCKAFIEYQQKYDNKTEVLLLKEKLKNLKDEYNYIKALLTSTENQIKSQVSTINTLTEKCNIIKDNIEYKQKRNCSPSQLDHQRDAEDLSVLENKIQYLDIQVATEVKNYQNELQRQSTTIQRLYEEMSMISLQLSEKEQEIRINELKLKELKKINQVSNEMIKKKQYEQNMKRENTRAQSTKLRITPNSTHNTSVSYPKNKIENLMSKTPTSTTSYNKSQKKPFQIKLSRNCGNGICSRSKSNHNTLPAIIPEREREVHNNSLEKDEMLEQIEALKSEIKTAMKANVNIRCMKSSSNCKDSDAIIRSNENKIFKPLIDPKSRKVDLYERIDQSNFTREEERNQIFNLINFPIYIP